MKLKDFYDGGSPEPTIRQLKGMGQQDKMRKTLAKANVDMKRHESSK